MVVLVSGSIIGFGDVRTSTSECGDSLVTVGAVIGKGVLDIVQNINK
jgi:hypothetical protein